MINNERILQNRYLIEKQIGAGGMGAVYLAFDRRFGSSVAIKESITSAGCSARLSRAFEHEAQLLNSLRHPALPHVIDYFVEGDSQFIAMEYIDGEDLSEMIERGRKFDIAEVLQWADDLLDALDYLHNQKFPVIHRDIKPQNLKLAHHGKIVLLDFGLAKGNPAELSQLTMSKSIFGYSRVYAPLEQIQGTGTDPRSDLYSLAATLYHLLTGSAPVDALTRAKAVLSEEADLLQSIRFFNPQVSIEIAEILHQALALNANIRPPTAGGMRARLAQAAFQIAELEEETIISSKSSGALTVNNSDQNSVAINNASSNKLHIKIKASVPPPVQSQLSQSTIISRPSFRSLKITAAVLSICGIAFVITKGYRSFPQTADSANSFQTTVAPAKPVKTAEPAITAQGDANLAPPLATASPTSEILETEKLDEPEKAIENEPKTVAVKSVKTNNKEKTAAPLKTLNAKNSVSDVTVKSEPIKENKEVIDGNSEKNDTTNANKPKNTGFKGLLNKIGSGATHIPKSIFKKKKN